MKDKNAFNVIISEQLKHCKDILYKKNSEYGQDTDLLHNFNVGAKIKNTTPEDALAGMMAKHTISIYDMCCDNKEYPLDVWNKKITDHMVYLALLKVIIVDKYKDCRPVMANNECFEVDKKITEKELKIIKDYMKMV